MYEDLMQAIRRWVMLSTSLPGERVIPADDPGTRPPMPYITVGFTTYDLELGTDEQRLSVSEDDELQVEVYGERQTSVSLNAYGRQGADLLALCHTSLSQPLAQRLLDKECVTLRAATATQDISALVDERIEKRFVKDFFATYAIQSSAQAMPHVEEVELDGALNSQTHTPLPITLEVD